MKNINVKFNMGDIRVDGIDGYFTQTKKGTFSQIHHIIPNDDGIGCKFYKWIGYVPIGNYGSNGPSGPIYPCGNKEFAPMTEKVIENYIKNELMKS